MSMRTLFSLLVGATGQPRAPGKADMNKNLAGYDNRAGPYNEAPPNPWPARAQIWPRWDTDCERVEKDPITHATATGNPPIPAGYPEAHYIFPDKSLCFYLEPASFTAQNTYADGIIEEFYEFPANHILRSIYKGTQPISRFIYARNTLSNAQWEAKGYSGDTGDSRASLYATNLRLNICKEACCAMGPECIVWQFHWGNQICQYANRITDYVCVPGNSEWRGGCKSERVYVHDFTAVSDWPFRTPPVFTPMSTIGEDGVEFTAFDGGDTPMSNTPGYPPPGTQNPR